MNSNHTYILVAAALSMATLTLGAQSVGGLTVSSSANIFSAGLTAPVGPGGGGTGTLPTVVPLSSGATAIQFTASGSVSQFYNLFFHGPDGLPGYSQNNSPYGGLSGFITDQCVPLAGVFLADTAPQGSPPQTLDFSSQGLGHNFLTLSPLLGQVFFVGDGQTDGGVTQTFSVPSGATRLFLGVPDCVDGQGLPGGYDDNEGSFQVSAIIVPEPSALQLAVLSVPLLAALRTSRLNCRRRP